MQRPALRSSLMIPGSPYAGPVIVIYSAAGRIASGSPGRMATVSALIPTPSASLGDLRIFPGFSRFGKCDSRERSESEHQRCVIPASLRAVEGPMREPQDISPCLSVPGYAWLDRTDSKQASACWSVSVGGSPLQPAGRIASGSPGKKAAAAENRYLLLVASLRLIRFSGGLSPVYGSDVFSVLHAFEVYAGDVVVCLCAGFFMCVAEGCHTKNSAA